MPRPVQQVWNYDPISRGLKHRPRVRNHEANSLVWNYDPISRGLKRSLLAAAATKDTVRVWNYDPISRGLKPHHANTLWR